MAINRNCLKWMALLTMLIDHIGYIFLATPDRQVLYKLFRGIGRISFILFAFLLVQGYLNTCNRKRYLARVMIFAVLSEIPFDLAFYGEICYASAQNVMFTLAIGILALFFYEKYEQNVLLAGLTVIVSCVTAYVLKTDYSYFGVLLILGLYVFRYQRWMQLVVAGVLIASRGEFEIWALFALPLCALYDGSKPAKRMPKYFFYAFYPVHMLVLWGLSKWIFYQHFL